VSFVDGGIIFTNLYNQLNFYFLIFFQEFSELSFVLH
jgi:hypothetical protein